MVLLLQRLDRLGHARHLFLERVEHLVALIERPLERVELLRVHRQLATELLLQERYTLAKPYNILIY